ncbi:hypothetical protein N8491_02660 [Akkermansiaceae bacterium]|nr:hypothetical protein [Akkermansiaceae bacterium]
MRRYLTTFLLLVGQGSGFTVWFNNIKLADPTAVPILDNTGISIEGGAGYVAAGTFSAPPEQITNFDEFEVFGDGSSSFNGIAAGFFDLRRSAPIPSGATNAPVGERIYVVIGDGDSLSTSTDFALFDSGLTFGTENVLGLGAADITITSENLNSESLIVGDILTDVDTGLGLTFEKAIRLTTVRVPLAPVLSADLKDFYPSEEGETLIVDATPVDGFPTLFTYQWYYNGDAYPISQGGRDATRTFAGSAVDNGTWTIVVSNTAGSASHTFDYRAYTPESSSPVLVVSEFYETALNQPVNIDATPISGYPVDFTFQWYFDGSAIDADQGGESRVFNLLGSANENGRWSVIVTNASGSTEQVFEYRVFDDSDGDGLSDYREQNILGTNFELSDTDSDGLSDSDEVNGSTDPIVADTDGDGLLDGVELTITNTDPIVADSDGDGIGDGEEDNDNDGLTNAQEIVTYLTDPLLADTDSDGLSDSTEVRLNLDPITATNIEELVSELGDLRAAFNNVVADRDARFVDTDGDGITDVKEAELETDTAEATVFYLQDAYEAAVSDSRIVGRSDVTGAPGAYDLTATALYDAVVADRDARFVDTDADGITDVKEAELETDTSEATVFYLQDAYEAAVSDSRIVGRSDVTGAPGAYDLTTTALYDAVVADRDARFVDTDADGITDIKETELETDVTKKTIFYLQSVYNNAIADARAVGRNDVTANPQSYELTTLAAYRIVVAERDRRFIDSDGDGLTNKKESELFSNPSEETTFYFQDSYDSAIADARESGLTEVLSNPQNYSLKTEEAYNLVVSQRDARFEDTDGDGITNLKEAELETDPNDGTVFYLENTGFEDAVAAARQTGRNDVVVFPFGYGLVALEDYNRVVAERDERFSDSDGDGLTDFKEAELETNQSLETVFYLRPAYTAAIAEARHLGRNDILESPQNFDLTTKGAFNAVLAERDARPTAEAYAAIVLERDTRYLDSDGDGLTDLKEGELQSNLATETRFILKDDHEVALQASRETGRNDVLFNPQNFELTTRAAFNSIVTQRDARFLDSDSDGLTDEKEGEIGTDANKQTSFFLGNTFENLFTDAKGAAVEEVLANLQNFGLISKQAYDVVLEERNSRFLDSDGDGLTDEKERELATDATEKTNFYLEEVYERAIAESLQVGRDDVTANPQNFNLATRVAYNSLLAQRNERFLDTDGDGLTNDKEEELETDPDVETLFSIDTVPLNFDFALAQVADEGWKSTSAGLQFALATTEDARFADSDLDGITDAKEEELNTNPEAQTVFYLKDVFDAAVVSSREGGRADVTTNPQNYELTPSAAYAAVLAERDARFPDSDGDGLTDDKENELASNALEETNFYLQGAYESALANARQTGRTEVTANPQIYQLKTQDAYNLIIAQRDARFIDSDEDGLTDLKEEELDTNSEEETSFYLQSVFETAVVTAQEEGRNAVTNNPANYDLTSQTLYNAVVAQRDARPTQEAYQVVVAQRDERFVDTDADGITDVKEAELSSDSQKVTTFYLGGVYQEAVLNARITGRGDVMRNPLDYELTTISSYNTAIEQRDARPTQVAYSSMVAQRDSRPTREEYNLVVQERDTRPTLGEVKDARLGSVVLQPDRANNSVKIRFSIEETDDFRNWTSRGGINELIMPLEAGKKFYRFAIEDE